MNRLWGKLGIIIALALVVIPATGISCNTPSASISEAAMAPDVNAQKQPVNPTDVFAADTPEIFCSFKLSNAPGDTHLNAEWVYIQGENATLANTIIATWKTTTDGTRYIEISLSPPGGWPGWYTGEYQVMLYLNSEEQASVPFTVE
ncbi:MAG: hypothetical protein U9Q31_02895 [Chloroflexota bacterium]|nr:hypothetical protein [Chloroflexota bacterium]